MTGDGLVDFVVPEDRNEDHAVASVSLSVDMPQIAGAAGKRLVFAAIGAAIAGRLLPRVGGGEAVEQVAAASGDPGTETRKGKRRKRHKRLADPASMPKGNEKLTLTDLDYAGWGTQRIQQWFGDKYCMWPDGHVVNDTWTAGAYTPAKTISKRLWAYKKILPMVEVRKETVKDAYPHVVKRQYEQSGVATTLEFTASVAEEFTDTTMSTSKTNLSLSQKIPLSFGETTFSIGQEFSTSQTISSKKTFTDTVKRNFPAVPKGVWVRFLVHRYGEKQVIDWEVPVEASGSIVANFPKVVGKPEDDPTGNGMFRTADVTEMVGAKFPSITGTSEIWSPYLVTTVTCAFDESNPDRRPDDSMFSAANCAKYQTGA